MFPKLYAITNCSFLTSSHLEIVQQMLAGGARLIQLRDKEASAKDLLEAARACLKATQAAGAKLIINDRVDVALASDADGVHLGQDDLSIEEARELLGPDKIIGISTHSLEQAERALKTSASYIAVGPIFATTTKQNPDPVVGLDLLRQVRALTDRPLVAIGGITLERAADVIAAGADTVAIISALYSRKDLNDIFAKPDITGSTRAYIEALEGKGTTNRHE